MPPNHHRIEARVAKGRVRGDVSDLPSRRAPSPAVGAGVDLFQAMSDVLACHLIYGLYGGRTAARGR
eukprot:9487564-Pyramimonas_sp.AAC.2